MAKNIHEIRDPIHVFIRMSTEERKIVDSAPFQRLRHIHQLALTYLTYPGATHKRFEHSLGVMELASRVFDVVTHPDAVTDEIRELVPEITNPDKLKYWRCVIRVAALCHDLGHLPFSHAAESALLPPGWDHERLTVEIIKSPEMQGVWDSLTPPLRPDDIIKLAVGPKKVKDLRFSDWEAILAEIIVGDAFGVDRIDYLLRDSYHAGVAYGRFDHYRLIDTLRILHPPANAKDGKKGDQVSREPVLGVEEGGLHSAEALLLARYFMYSQVYFHPVRRIYDIHLKDFLEAWLPGGKFPIDVPGHLSYTDNEVTAALRQVAVAASDGPPELARRIICREHFKAVYQRNPEDVELNPDAVNCIYGAAVAQFGSENVRMDSYTQRGGGPDFPVLTPDRRVVSSLSLSQTLKSLPVVAVDYVFVRPSLRDGAAKWLEQNRSSIISEAKESES